MKETELRIRIYPDPVLKKKTTPVSTVTDEHRRILSRMAQLMYETSGIGLAANQAGILESMIPLGRSALRRSPQIGLYASISRWLPTYIRVSWNPQEILNYAPGVPFGSTGFSREIEQNL